jgi:hypothetical protein
MARGSGKFSGFRSRGRDARDYAHQADDPRVPIAGCHCWTCQNRREDAHYGRVGELTGLDDAPVEPKSGGDR